MRQFTVLVLVATALGCGSNRPEDRVVDLDARIETLEAEIERLEERDANIACAVWGVAQAFHISHATGGTGAPDHGHYFNDSTIWNRRYARIREACSGDEQMRMLDEATVVLGNEEMPPQ